MKKIFVIVLAFALVLSFGAFAFAATSAPAGEASATEATGTDTTDETAVKVPSPNKTDLIIIHDNDNGNGKGNGNGNGGDKPAGAVIVKFITGEVQKGTPINAPYTEEGKAAVELADKVVKAIGDDIEDEALKEAIEAFLKENEGSLASGIITMGEDAAEDSVKLAVSAKGFDKVMFNAPGDAENLAFVVLEG